MKITNVIVAPDGDGIRKRPERSQVWGDVDSARLVPWIALDSGCSVRGPSMKWRSGEVALKWRGL